MFELSDLLICVCVAAFLMLWWNAQGVKQTALSATRRHCKKMDVMLLDDSVALRGFWLKRDQSGKLHIWRSYNFEFSSTGHERYTGQIILLGLRVESIDLQPYRIN